MSFRYIFVVISWYLSRQSISAVEQSHCSLKWHIGTPCQGERADGEKRSFYVINMFDLILLECHKTQMVLRLFFRTNTKLQTA